MINLEDIKYSYPNSDFHLSIDQLKIEQGNRTAVIGPSGFGKTTMLNLIAGIILPDEGKISISETEINLLPDDNRRNYRLTNIGFVFQDFKLIEYLNVLDNIILPSRINKVLELTNDLRERGIELAKSLDIDDKLQKYPSKLSQGEKQRVAICRALLNNPAVILADEPTGNLDPENKKHIMNILFEYVEKYNSTLITVTHDHELLDGFESIIDFKDFHQK
jgi:putative ABC transport system ATP-binding protein